MINEYDEFWIYLVANDYIKLMSHIKVKKKQCKQILDGKETRYNGDNVVLSLVFLHGDRFGKSFCMDILIKIGRSRNVVKHFMFFKDIVDNLAWKHFGNKRSLEEEEEEI